MTEQKERLKKLYALALRGVGGEKEQAQAILDKLLKKYAMTLDDLDDEVIQEYDLEYHGKEQDRILMQTATTTDRNQVPRNLYRLGVVASFMQKMTAGGRFG